MIKLFQSQIFIINKPLGELVIYNKLIGLFDH